MTTLQFGNTHNLDVFLTKSAESEGFEQIFWSIAKVKTVNEEQQLQALVDGKKIIITEATIRRDLQLKDANGVDCLPNATIFKQLILMGVPVENVANEAVYEESDDSLERSTTTATGLDAEKDRGTPQLHCKEIVVAGLKESVECKKQTVVANSTTKAEYVAASSCCGHAKTVNREVQLQALVDGKKIIITEATVRRDLQLEDANGVDCLLNATIFEQLTLMGMMKNLDSAVKFLMYPRFVQVFLNNQLEGMETHNRIYIAPSHTKKVFANMKRQGKDFSGRVTSLFPTMVVQVQEEQGKGSDMPTITQPSSSQPQKKLKPRKPEKKDTQIPQSNVPSDNLVDEAVNEENVSNHSNDLLLNGEDRLKLQELMTLCTNLQNRVLDLEHTMTTQTLEIDSLKRRVKKIEKKQRLRTHGLRRLYKVGLSARVVSFEDEGLGEEDASKQGRKIHDIDADEDITLENVHDIDADEDITLENVHD
ncbi:hypothetical protein Tco_0598180, partial [Tanacetum coccineum]